jgi:hypothetical protein
MLTALLVLLRLAKGWREWRTALGVVRPETVLRWHRQWRPEFRPSNLPPPTVLRHLFRVAPALRPDGLLRPPSN